MEYLLLIATDESAMPEYGSGDFEAWMAGWTEFSRSLMESGRFVAGAGLQPSATATTVRKTVGADWQVIDGPYAETKEQLGGFYVITAADLDEALAVAESLPITGGSVEVRPLAYRPDAAPAAAV
jgi:hypothetical protein